MMASGVYNLRSTRHPLASKSLDSLASQAKSDYFAAFYKQGLQFISTVLPVAHRFPECITARSEADHLCYAWHRL